MTPKAYLSINFLNFEIIEAFIAQIFIGCLLASSPWVSAYSVIIYHLCVFGN